MLFTVYGGMRQIAMFQKGDWRMELSLKAGRAKLFLLSGRRAVYTGRGVGKREEVETAAVVRGGGEASPLATSWRC